MKLKLIFLWLLYLRSRSLGSFSTHLNKLINIEFFLLALWGGFSILNMSNEYVGNKQYSWNTKTSKWKFTCQHGKNFIKMSGKQRSEISFSGRPECELNRLHACILEHLSFDNAFYIVSCLMRTFQTSIDDVSAFNLFH